MYGVTTLVCRFGNYLTKNKLKSSDSGCSFSGILRYRIEILSRKIGVKTYRYVCDRYGLAANTCVGAKFSQQCWSEGKQMCREDLKDKNVRVVTYNQYL